MYLKQSIIWYAIILHWLWGALLLSTPIPLGVTAISTIIHLGLITGTSAGIFYLLISVSALLGLISPRPTNIFFLLPQTGVLWLAAYGAIMAMVRGSFADGIIRPTSFLVTDQAHSVIVAILHSIAVFTIATDKSQD